VAAITVTARGDIVANNGLPLIEPLSYSKKYAVMERRIISAMRLNSDQSHEHKDRRDGRLHPHGALDSALFATQRGMQALKWSFLGLLATALLQMLIVLISGSVALLADAIHNFGDAATAIPLLIAFMLARWQPSKRFTYGYGRMEDLAGVIIVLTILSSAVVATYESIDRLLHPKAVGYIGTVIAAAVIGFLGNEAVAQFRIRVGKEIGSAALVADGYHARIDGFASLAVIFGAVGVWLGYPLADPLVGLLIATVIFRIVWESGKSVFTRLLDGVDPEVADEVEDVVDQTPGVQEVSEVRVRWLGHRLHAEVNIAVNSRLSVKEGHKIALAVRHQLLHHLRYLSHVTVHVDPADASGEKHHRVTEHNHDDLPAHSH
jgi:cation diffusion facilitator family transporter